MGLLDDLKNQVVSEMGGGADHAGMVEAAMGMINNAGGLSALAQKFQQNGLGDMVAAWIKTGPNPPITQQQVQQVLGSDAVQALAQKVGLSGPNASALLVTVLPTLVDKLTPNGQIPTDAGGLLESGVNFLKKSGLV
jgi:uncharacterized protein YidB (DUF937 family)